MFTFDHSAISVDNLEQSVDFYKKLGFKNDKEFHDENLDIVYLSLGDMCLELFHYVKHNNIPDYYKDNDTNLHTVGNKHFAFRVEDILKAKEFIENNDIYSDEIILKKGRTCKAYFFIKDPNGIYIEFIEK